MNSLYGEKLCLVSHTVNRQHYLIRILSAAEKCKQYSGTVLGRSGYIKSSSLKIHSYLHSQVDKITKGAHVSFFLNKRISLYNNCL